MAQKSLSERIQAAIKGGASRGVQELIFEAEAAAKTAVTDHEAARERALDPLLSADDVTAARKAMEDAEFTRERMTKAAAVLREKLVEFEGHEDQERRHEVYAAAKAKLDDVTGRIFDRYPVLANELGALLRDAVEADKIVIAANRDLPDAAPDLPSVDMLLRGTPTGFAGRAELAREVKLPSLTSGGRYIWGPNGGNFALAFHPEPNAEPATGTAATEEPVSPGNRPGSSVRLVSQHAGEAA